MHLHHLLVILVALDGPPRDTVPLYTDLGDHHVPITTPVSLAQQYFDQGLRLLYGFNHGEAIRSFNHAAQLDSNCAMCYWGVAYAYGPHVNAGMDSAAGVAAYQALQRALARERGASPRERAYIDALAKRYAPIPPADRAALDAAYAAAMGDVVKRYPNDLDAATLYAEALMDKRPWNYWDKKTGEPYPATTPVEVAKQVPFLEPYLYYPYLTLVTFGRWDELLARPLPPADLPYSRAMGQYARGIALAARGRFTEARAALDTLKQIAASGTRAYASAGWTTPSTNLQLATHALLGEIAARQGGLEEGIAHFREAMKIEDDQLYTEPPDWYYPIRHSLAAVLLRADQPVEAERLYREDLKRFPESGWSLFGLAQALRAQGKSVEAADVDARFARAWAGADVTLTASRF